MYNLHIYEREDLTPIRKLLMMKALAGGEALKEYTETGNPVTFETNVAKPLSVVAAFTTVQAGSGDPSPDNVRPITGFTGATVCVSNGENAYNKTGNTNFKYIDSDGELQETIYFDVTDFIAVSGGSPVLYDGITNAGNAPYSAFYDAQKQFISSFKQKTGENIVIAPNNAAFVRFSLSHGNPEDINTFIVYSGQSVSVTFPDGQTVYGGTPDLTTGVLTVTHKGVSLNDPDKWTKPSANIVYDVYFNDRKQNYRWGDPCTCFPTENGVSTGTPFLGWEGQTQNRYAIYTNSSDITLDDVKALATAEKIFAVYELATPLVYQLSPVEILSLVGENVLWSDLNGDMTVTYKKKG